MCVFLAIYFFKQIWNGEFYFRMFCILLVFMCFAFLYFYFCISLFSRFVFLSFVCFAFLNFWFCIFVFLCLLFLYDLYSCIFICIMFLHSCTRLCLPVYLKVCFVCLYLCIAFLRWSFCYFHQFSYLRIIPLLSDWHTYVPLFRDIFAVPRLLVLGKHSTGETGASYGNCSSVPIYV